MLGVDCNHNFIRYVILQEFLLVFCILGYGSYVQRLDVKPYNNFHYDYRHKFLFSCVTSCCVRKNFLSFLVSGVISFFSRLLFVLLVFLDLRKTSSYSLPLCRNHVSFSCCRMQNARITMWRIFWICMLLPCHHIMRRQI